MQFYVWCDPNYLRFSYDFHPINIYLENMLYNESANAAYLV